jgi:FixJ family two-component response regulator
MRYDEGIVYVVDDQKVIVETLATTPRRAGFSAIAFEDPNQALVAAGEGPHQNSSCRMASFPATGTLSIPAVMNER